MKRSRVKFKILISLSIKTKLLRVELNKYLDIICSLDSFEITTFWEQVLLLWHNPIHGLSREGRFRFPALWTWLFVYCVVVSTNCLIAHIMITSLLWVIKFSHHKKILCLKCYYMFRYYIFWNVTTEARAVSFYSTKQAVNWS